MLASEPIESAPMHSLRFAAFAIQNTGLPAQSFPESVHSPSRAIIGGFPLTGVSQPRAVATGEDA